VTLPTSESEWQEALRQAEQRVRMETQLECRLTPDDWRDAVEQAREQGQRDALAGAVRMLLLCAKGRREYAQGAPEGMAAELLAETRSYEHAAAIVKGDIDSICSALPSWMWDDIAAIKGEQ
jgi:hypothetical protein